MLGSLGTLLLVSAVGVTDSNPNGYFYLETGGYIAGQVLSDDGSTVAIRLRDSNEVEKHAYADFTNRTQYKLRLHTVAADSGSGQLMMGNFSLELGLFREATRHFRLSARLMPTLWQAAGEGLRRVEVAAANLKLDMAANQLGSGRFSDAERILIELSEHADESIANHAQALMDSFPDVTRSKPYSVEQSFPSFAKVRKYYERAKESNRDGLLHTYSGSRAQRDFRSAAKDIKRGLRLLNKIRKKQGRTGLFERAALDLQRDLLELHASTALNQSSLHVVQQSFRQALTVLNGALAYDQTNAHLLDARMRVEQAASSASAGVVLSSL